MGKKKYLQVFSKKILSTKKGEYINDDLEISSDGSKRLLVNEFEVIYKPN